MSFIQITLIIVTTFLMLYVILAIAVKVGYDKLETPPKVPIKIGLTTLAIFITSACVAVEMLVAIIYFIIITIKSC